MENASNDLLAITSGLDRITTRQKRVGRRPRPSSGPVLPSEAHPEKHLDRVIKPPGIDHRLMAFFRPEISRKEILTPTGYRTVMEDARNRLSLSAKNISGGETASLKAAAALLDRELENLDLLNMYRGSLLKG